MNRSASDMTRGPVLATLLKFSIPLILTGLLQQCYQIADALICGNLIGEDALAAVNLSQPMMNVCMFVITALTTGCTLQIAHASGAGRTDDIRAITVTATVVLPLAAIIAAAFGIAFARPLMTALNTPSELFGAALQYLVIVLVGIPFTTLYNLSAAILRGLGDSRTPLYALALSVVLNLALDVLFIAGFHGGIAGAAWATVLAQLIASVFLTLRLMHMLAATGARPALRQFSLPLFSGCVKLGVPIMLRSSVFTIMNLVLSAVNNSFGYDVVVAVTTFYKVDSLILLPIFHVGTGISVFTGTNLGAGREDRARAGMKQGAAMLVVYALPLIVLQLCFGLYVFRLFGVSYTIARLSQFFAVRLSIFYPAQAINQALCGYLEGRKDVGFTSLASILSGATRAGLCYALAGIAGPSIIVYGEGIAWLLLTALCVWRVIHIHQKEKSTV